jgi:pyruvate dehydrogenase E2 component (dihydrolipoamide acetyltransferase)
MIFPIRAPRVNNNDDVVRVGKLLVAIGDKVCQGDPVIEIETDKALFTVEAEAEGYVLKSQHKAQEEVPIGAILVWLGSTPDDQAPSDASPGGTGPESRAPAEITTKARLLMERHGLTSDMIPHSGARLSAADVEAYLADRPAGPAQAPSPKTPGVPPPEQPLIAGTLESLSPAERGMLRTVLWHREHAVPGYLEVQYDPRQWNSYALAFMEMHRMLMPPLLPLLAHRLVTLAQESPKLNATLWGSQRYMYAQVNLGFTVQAGALLYIVVVPNAGMLSQKDFVNSLSELQRRAAGRSLSPGQTAGATIAFSSMARWNVSRHIPILPPHCSLIVAHASPRGGPAVLGATYDHRVLSGYEVLTVLEKLTAPPEKGPAQ